jgi:GNAT superfamily N-acetyltransferase
MSLSFFQYTITAAAFGVGLLPPLLLGLSKIYNRCSYHPPLPGHRACQDVHVFNLQHGTTEPMYNDDAHGRAQLILELIDCMAASFCGTTTKEPERFMNWALGSRLSMAPVRKQTSDNHALLQQRLVALRWVMGYVVHETLSQGHGSILYIRAPSGEIGAASVLQFKDTNRHGYVSLAMATVTSYWLVVTTLGLPPWMAESNWPTVGVQYRLDHGALFLKDFHARWCNGLHLYTAIMATSPGYQGRGYCGQIMKTTVALGRELELDVYLETGGERNQKIYQKYGYVLVEEKELVLEDDIEPNLVYSAMLKKHQKRGEGWKKE